MTNIYTICCDFRSSWSVDGVGLNCPAENPTPFFLPFPYTAAYLYTNLKILTKNANVLTLKLFPDIPRPWYCNTASKTTKSIKSYSAELLQICWIPWPEVVWEKSRQIIGFLFTEVRWTPDYIMDSLCQYDVMLRMSQRSVGFTVWPWAPWFVCQRDICVSSFEWRAVEVEFSFMILIVDKR